MEDFNSKNGIKKSIIRQLLWFSSYFLFCSLFLFNHSGGADIGFIFFFSIFSLGHLITAIVKTVSSKTWTIIDILTIIVLLIAFYSVITKYLRLMWEVTSALKGSG